MDAFPKSSFDWSAALSVKSYGPDDPEPAPSPDRMDHLYRLGEAIFRVVGPQLVENGWSVFPQEKRGGRGPGRCGGAAIRWKPYQARLPSKAEVLDWAIENPSHNVAIITGAASANLFVLDVDCDDPNLAWAIRELAKERMPTPFTRVGRAPRVILAYRLPEGDSLFKTTIRFATPDGLADEANAIEILANGAPWTAYGHHHKTGRYFKWLGNTEPLRAHVTEVPVVSSERVAAFLRACDAIRPIYRRPTTPSSPGAMMAPTQGASFRPTNGHGVTVLAPELGDSSTGAWTIADHVIVDGREAYLQAWCWSLVRHNEHCVRGNRDALLVECAQVHAETYMAADGKRGREAIARDAAEKVRRACAMGRAGDLTFARPLMGAGGRLESPASRDLPAERPRDGSLDWIGGGDVASAVRGCRNLARTTAPVEIPGAREQRALLADRSEVSARIAAGIDAAIGGYLADVDAGVGRVHVVPAPTGAGKTSRVIPRLVEYLKEHPLKQGEEPRPIVVLAPTHENLASMRALAEAAGAAFEAGVPGVEAVVFGGKLWAGCHRADDVARLQRAQIGSSGLCSARVRNPGGDDYVVARCKFWDSCGYQRMRERARAARLILAPRTFLTQRTLPKELSNALAVVIDESITHELLACAQMPVASIAQGRAETVLTKKEREEGLDYGFLAENKLKAARLATRALLEGGDVAAAFVENLNGGQMLGDARRVCDSAMTIVREVTPDTTSLGVAALAEAPTAIDLALEARFWSVVEDRWEKLVLDGKEPLSKPRAKGAADARLQHRRDVVDMQDVDMVRVSWRPRRHWDGRPTLLMDASSDPDIVGHLFSSEVVRADLDVPLDLRIVAAVESTHSPSSYCPPKRATREKRREAARRIDETQRVISHVAAQYGWGRTSAIAAKKVRPVLFGSRAASSNVDEAHFGAMRGLDRFKDHVAAVVVGRTEQPTWVVDGLVGALTFDMDEPEMPLDALGTGLTADGKPAMRTPMPRTLHLRSGHDTTVGVLEMPGVWGRRLDRQWREEETRQALGRLRPVHASAARWETPVAVVLSSCIPEGLVIDEVTTVADILAAPSAWVGEAVRDSRGVLCPRITPHLSGHSEERIREFVDETTGRSTWGFTPVAWKDSAGVTTHCYVQSHFEDPEAALFDALTAAGMENVTIARVVAGEPSKPRVAGQERGADKVSSVYLNDDQRAERDRLFAEWRDLRGHDHMGDGQALAAFEMESA